jgi:hypothetical protein
MQAPRRCPTHCWHMQRGIPQKLAIATGSSSTFGIVGVIERDPDVGDTHTCLPDGRYGVGEASEEGLCLG